MFAETTPPRRSRAGALVIAPLWVCLLIMGMSPALLQAGEHETFGPSDSMPGLVTGTVWALGKHPSASRLPVFKNAEYCGTSLPDRSLLVDHEGRLQAAAVILEPVGRRVAVSPERAVLDNRRCAFTPRVQIVPAGSAVVLKNSDPILHAVHARLGKETLFNVGLPSWRQVTQVFRKPGIVAVDCDVLHTWMRASVIVTLSPYFAVTDERGHFQIASVPAGFYDLVVWHEVLGKNTKRIRVSTAEASVTDITYAMR